MSQISSRLNKLEQRSKGNFEVFLALGESGLSQEAQEAKMDAELEAQFAERGVDPEVNDIMILRIFYEPKPEWVE